MHVRSIFAIVMAFTLLTACGANTEASRQRLLESGNEYYQNGKYREAVIMYSRALQQDRRFGEAYFRLAKAELQLGRVVQAARALHRATELQPGNTEAFSTLADIYLAGIDTDPLHRENYVREIEDILAVAEQRGVAPFELMRVRGYLALSRGQAADAADWFRKAIELDAGKQALYLALMRALRASGDHDEAERLALDQIEKDPKFVAIYDRLYTIYLLENDQRKAENLIESKCKAIPESTGCKLQLAAHYHRVGNRKRRDEILGELVDGETENTDLLDAVGTFYERIKGYEEALQYFRRAAEIGSADQNYFRLRVAHILSTTGRAAEALEIVETVLRDEPDNPPAIALRGAIRLYGGDPASVQEAIDDLEEVIADMPKNPVLRYNLGRAYLSVGDVDKATVQFQEAAGMLPTYEAPRLDLARIYLMADREQPATAAQLADEVLKLNPTSVPGRLVRADAAIRLREFNQARSLLASLLAESPGNPDVQFMYAALHMAEHNYADAETILRRLYLASPGDARGIRGLVGVYVVQGKDAEALRMLDKELEENPNNRQLLMLSASVAAAAADYNRAIAQYDQILAQNPEQADIHLAIGMAYYNSHDLRKAESHFRSAARVAPRSQAAQLRLSMLLGETGRFDEAREILDAVLKASPDNPIALNNMAFILAGSERTRDTAQTLAQQAVNRSRGADDRVRDSISETLAYIYLQKNLYDNAIEIYGQVVPRNPENAAWRYRFAQALFAKGDMPRARDELEQALAARPPKRLGDQIRSLLRQTGG